MANMAQAIRMALHFAEDSMDVKDVFGQDVGLHWVGFLLQLKAYKLLGIPLWMDEELLVALWELP